MTDPSGQAFGVNDTDCRYLSLIRDLADETAGYCHVEHYPEDATDAMHRFDATAAINAFLGNPELLWKLMVVSARFDKSPPPGLDELKQQFWSLAARRGPRSDGSWETTFSDG